MAFEKQRRALQQELREALLFVEDKQAFGRLLSRALAEGGRSLQRGPAYRWSLLPVIICETVCGDYIRALPVGAAVHLALTAGDLLDDVEDRDVKGQLQRDYGQPQMVNAASALLTLSYLTISRLREREVDAETTITASKAISEAVLKGCQGQYWDLLFESKAEVAEEMYLRVVELKAGALIECACKLGALLATLDPDLMSAYALFGRNVGMATQVANDALGLRSARLAEHDIKKRKKTLPVIYGLRTAEGDDLGILRQTYQGTDAISEAQSEKVQTLLVRLGAVHYSLVVAQIYKDRSIDALKAAGVRSDAIQKLSLLLQL